MRHARVVSALGFVILLGGCSDVLEVPRDDQEIKPLMTVDTDSRLAALGVSRQVKQSRRRGGDRDSVNVVRCVLRKQQANGRYRSWKVALPVPGERPGPNARYRTFKYRGVPEGSTSATHTADCIVPNNADAIRLASELITGSAPDTATSAATSGAAFGASVKRTLSQLVSALLPRPLAAAATRAAQDVWYCFREHEGYALCHLPGIEVTAPPPPPPPDDCGAGPDPYESGLWCECWEYGEEPFWCAYEFGWEDWPVYEEPGGSGGSGGGGFSVDVACTPSSVTRAGSVTCTASASGGPLQVIDWTFNAQSGTGLGPVTHVSSSATWFGNAVTGGSVTVKVMEGTDTAYASTSISVSPRNWSVDLSLGGEMFEGETGETWFTTSTSVLLGQNINAITQISSARWSGGYSSASVPSGPNSGYAYVASETYHHDRAYWINRYLTDWAPADLVHQGVLYNRYGATYVLGGNPNIVLNGAHSHEGSGGPGTRGHNQGFAVASGSGHCGNISERIEGLVREGSQALQNAVNVIDSNAYGHVYYETSHWFVHGHYQNAPSATRTPTNATALPFSFSGDPQVPEGTPVAC
jgi:hypothetical protein